MKLSITSLYKYTAIAVLPIILSGLIACNKDFLDRTPKDKQVEETFYKSPDDAFKALVAAYSVLNWEGFGNIWLSSELASDNCFGGGGLADNGHKHADKFEKWEDMNKVSWKKNYTGIYRANKFLQEIDGANFGTDQALKARYTGEAQFLRAYFYFDQVRMYGNIPLLTAPIEGENYYIPQASPDSVYALIANDLKAAIENLTASAKPFTQIPPEEYGRITKWAAEALLARVYLYYTGYYNKADLAGVYTKQQVTAAIDDVITNSGYDLVDDFGTLWRASAYATAKTFAGQNNKEGVFTIQYSEKGKGNWNQLNGNRVQVMVGLRGISELAFYTQGWGVGTVNPALYNAYESGDSIRRKASFIGIQEDGLTAFKPSSDQVQYTGYFWKKYTPITLNKVADMSGDFQIDNYDNYVVIRFADVLLMGAELHLATNLSTAQNYFNRVRDRAFKKDITHRKVLTADAAGLKTIFEERRLELALEGVRYWDILRQGMPAGKQIIDNNTGGDFTSSFRTETNGLFAIPDVQIGLSNGTLKQNNGWTN